MYNEYMIKDSDTLSKIAKDNNVSLDDLLNANEFNNLKLQSGQSILVPSSKDNPFIYYTVEKDDTLYKIADAYGVDASMLARLNRINLDQVLFVGAKLLIPKEGVSFYITEENDTMEKILNKIGTNYQNLRKENPMVYLIPNQLIVYRE